MITPVLRRTFAIAAGLLASLAGAGEITELPSPAGPGAMGSSLTRGPDGTVHLSWLEPAAGESHALKFARFDAAARHWSEAQTIATGPGWFVNWADFPQLAVQGDRMTAVWFEDNPATPDHGGHHGSGYHARTSASTDGGKTWGTSRAVSAESRAVEFVALQPLPNGRLLAAWLDGRAGEAGMQLWSRVLGDGNAAPDTLVDPLVCDCCQLAFTALPDGGALLAYRGRSQEEVRDMKVARFRGDRWEPPRPLPADGWKIAACPVNGPRLAQTGGSTAAVWFTGADGKSRVNLATSADAGQSFGKPVRLDLGRPQGRVDAAALPDGTAVLTWLEMSGADGTPGGIQMRTLSPAGKLSAPVMLAPTQTTRATGFPRLVWLEGKKLLLSYTEAGEPGRVRTLLVTLD
ncbi:MAG: sialidase family protein [Lacunisphaera sp.]|nr:sialidase family protein [Lacunisphaera sp.]